jgi:glyoxylase-like metal-dependent hydrolase (beta-lactamase superfamily II)
MTATLGKRPFTKGLHDLGNGAYAYLQPDGSWGWSNAGLVVDSGESLLVDTLFDLKLTTEMLQVMKAVEPRAAARIKTLVNTHSNGDHCNGNELVSGAEIIASRATAEEMKREGPQRLAAFKKSAAQMGKAGAFFADIFRPFDFEGITQTLPTLTFEGRMNRMVGNKKVELIQVGPAHTEGDVLAYVPENKTIFTGDILFIGGHPIIWAGPVANWIAACQLMLDMDLETVVPGHGPVTDMKGVAAVKNYLEYITDEARKRFDAGMSASEAARDISLADYSAWGDAERIVVNVATLYREFSADKKPLNVVELFELMADLASQRRH